MGVVVEDEGGEGGEAFGFARGGGERGSQVVDGGLGGRVVHGLTSRACSLLDGFQVGVEPVGDGGHVLVPGRASRVRRPA